MFLSDLFGSGSYKNRKMFAKTFFFSAVFISCFLLEGCFWPQFLIDLGLVKVVKCEV